MYDWRDLNAVKTVVLGTTHMAPLTVEDIHLATRVEGRTVRQILSDIDGLEFLLGGTAGYFICEYQEDGDALTHSLQSQVSSMHLRLDRRLSFTPRLPQRQGHLW